VQFIRSLAVFTAITFASGAVASAQQFQYYFPPKLVKRAAATVPTHGKGKVVVQVELDPHGKVVATRVISSTNKANDAAALDIAKHSTYAPARRGSSEGKAKGERGFYDFTLMFTESGGVQAKSPVDQAIDDINKNQYAAARDALTPYLKQNPGDGKAQALLGIAQYYLKDYDASTAAFDQAGAAIPASYKNLAADAYAQVTQERLSKGDNQDALVSAKRAVGLSPSVAYYNLLGLAEMTANDSKAAIGDILKARDLAAEGKTPAGDRATIDVNLAQAYANAGDADNAQKYLAEAKSLDPKVDTKSVYASVYAIQAKAELDAKDYPAAAKLYDQGGGQLTGKYAAAQFSNAAFAYISLAQTQDPKTASATLDAALAEANKALQVDPKFALALYAQGAVFANQGRKDAAIATLKQADAAATTEGDASLAAAIEKTLKQVQGGS